ncbi:MAG: hypothetical protein ACKO2P_06430 [Planctomycetota bacterium]
MRPSNLLTSVTIADLSLPNRIAPAPLTRYRAGTSRLPHQIMAKYYGQRASAGLLIAEATAVMPDRAGLADTPGISSQCVTQYIFQWTTANCTFGVCHSGH